jgi:hypothetical protein
LRSGKPRAFRDRRSGRACLPVDEIATTANHDWLATGRRATVAAKFGIARFSKSPRFTMKCFNMFDKAGVLKTLFTSVLAGLVIALLAAPVTGHGIFKKTLEKKYKEEGLRVTCNMCHVKGEPKTERNEVGKTFFEQLKGQDLSARWDAVEGDQRKELENDVMAPAFLKALDTIYELEQKGELESSLNTQLPAG